MPQKSAVPSHDDTSTAARVPAKAQVIPLSPEATSVFASENSRQERVTTPHAEPARVSHTDHAVAEPHAAELVPRAPATTDPRSRARTVIVAVLGVAVLTAAGYFAYAALQGRGLSLLPPDTGSLSVTSEPNGQPVVIDGVARGTTPLQLALAPGAHTVQVGSGAQARNQTITIARGGTSSLHQGLAALTASANAGTGGLQVSTEPPGARVWIDGTLQGVAPVTVKDLSVGEHQVTVRGSSGEPVNRTVLVQDGTVASLVVSMVAPAGFTSGWLALSSTIPLQILEKGTVIGTTESPRILLPTGSHELELVNSELGYQTTRTVQIAAGQTATVTVRPPTGVISINAVPWAEIWIDGKPAGETPIGNLSLAIGKHDVLFRHPELGEQVRSVTVGLTAPVRISADMRKK